MKQTFGQYTNALGNDKQDYRGCDGCCRICDDQWTDACTECFENNECLCIDCTWRNEETRKCEVE
jgi:hypothetical protein